MFVNIKLKARGIQDLMGETTSSVIRSTGADRVITEDTQLFHVQQNSTQRFMFQLLLFIMFVLCFIECFTTTFLPTHSWLNWVDEDYDEDEVGLKEKPEDTRYIKQSTTK